MDGLEAELGGKAQTIRLNVAEPAGQRARERYRLEKVPAIVLHDAEGRETYRTEGKLPRRQEIRQALDR